MMFFRVGAHSPKEADDDEERASVAVARVPITPASEEGEAHHLPPPPKKENTCWELQPELQAAYRPPNDTGDVAGQAALLSRIFNVILPSNDQLAKWSSAVFG
jgi:hypothetical protein